MGGHGYAAWVDRHNVEQKKGNMATPWRGRAQAVPSGWRVREEGGPQAPRGCVHTWDSLAAEVRSGHTWLRGDTSQSALALCTARWSPAGAGSSGKMRALGHPELKAEVGVRHSSN